jgi:hypothetical protein
LEGIEKRLKTRRGRRKRRRITGEGKERKLKRGRRRGAEEDGRKWKNEEGRRG